MTANTSLLDSCTTIIISQGITLHSDSQSKTAIDLGFKKRSELQPFLRFKILSTSQTKYINQFA